MKGHLMPSNERAVAGISDALRDQIAKAQPNSVITVTVKINARGEVSGDTTIEPRLYPLRGAFEETA